MTSENNLFSPFPGTRPYSEIETTNFYGRERETQDVLDILKRYKLVTICGENGSGKSSLIQAGIIPKLRKGFLGQTGKEWVICNFRPGVSPIENLSYALSDSGAMYLKGKSKTTDHQNYKSKIEEKRDLGLIEIFASSEIYEKKNLLIVIDQLEDFFKFPDYFDVDKNSDDDILFDLVYRTSKYKQTSIYFVLALDIDYLGKLNSYDRFTEILNQTQYKLPHIGKGALSEISKNTLHKRNIQLSDEILDDIGEKLNDAPHLLPDIQYFLFSINSHYANPMPKEIIYLDIEKISQLGNYNEIFEKDLEKSYQNLNNSEKKQFELLLRCLCSGNKNRIGIFYIDINYIINLLKISEDELTKIIKNFQQRFGNSLDIFKKVIRGVPAEEQKIFDKTDILSVKYQSILNWKRFIDWKNDEDKKFEIYSENYYKAKKYPAESLLTATSLETASLWLMDKFVHKEWSDKYLFNFNLTSEYIKRSEDTNQKEVRLQEKIKNDIIKSKNTRKRIYISFSIIIVAILGFVGIYRYNAKHREAEVNKRERALAIKEKKITDSLYSSLKEFTLMDSLNNALLLKEKEAKSQLFQDQLMSQKELVGLKQRNDEQNRLIELKKEKIFKDSIEANKLMNVALKESKRAELSQKFIDLKDSLSLLLYNLNNTTLNDYDKGLLKKLTKNSILNYDELKFLGDQLNRDYDDDNLRQVSVNLIAKLNGENEYSQIEKYDLVKQNKKPLKAINISSNGKLATGGDSKILFSSTNSIDKNIQPLEPITNFSSSINSLEFLNDNLIAVGLENSEIWFVEVSSMKKVRVFQIKDWKPGKIIKKSIQNISTLVANFNKTYFKGVSFLEYDRITNKLYATLEKSMIEIDIAKIDSKNKDFIKTIPLESLSEEEFITSMAFSDLSETIYIATNQGNIIAKGLKGEKDLKLSNDFLKLRNKNAIEIEFYSDKVLIGTQEGGIFVYKLEDDKNLTYLGSKRANFSKVNDLLYDDKNIYALTENGSLTIIDDKNFEKSSKNKKIKTPVSISLGDGNFGNAIESFSQNGITYFVTADQVGNLVYWDLDLDNTFEEISRLYSELN